MKSKWDFRGIAKELTKSEPANWPTLYSVQSRCQLEGSTGKGIFFPLPSFTSQPSHGATWLCINNFSGANLSSLCNAGWTMVRAEELMWITYLWLSPTKPDNTRVIKPQGVHRSFPTTTHLQQGVSRSTSFSEAGPLEASGRNQKLLAGTWKQLGYFLAASGGLQRHSKACRGLVWPPVEFRWL